MIKVSNEELTKIAQFVSSCEDMINGKFILADVKITKILNMIAESDELYRFISECLMNYDFSREYHRAEVKNTLNNGSFVAPTEPSKLVAFVFCLLVECDAKRIDFYSFINENFKAENRTDAYQNFANQLLVPFKDIIATNFAIGGDNQKQVEDLTEQYRSDLNSEPIFEDSNQNFDHQNQYNQFDYQNQNFAENYNAQYFEQDQNQQYEMHEQDVNIQNNAQQPEVEEESQDSVWQDIKDICSNIESSVYAERKIKPYLKDELLYILDTIKYSTKYNDLKIISALVTAFDELTKKFRSVQFVFGELKNKLEDLYK